jgi:hypothetical protein
MRDDPAPWVQRQAEEAIGKLEQTISNWPDYSKLRNQINNIAESNYDAEQVRALVQFGLYDEDLEIRKLAIALLTKWGEVNLKEHLNLSHGSRK